MSENKNKIDRRGFLKLLGSGTAATTAALVGCNSGSGQRGGTALSEVPTDKMTYRTAPKTGEQVSVLGYGCMRWPTIGNDSARDSSEEIDQQMVNQLIDYAIAHGVNYFDTSPAYCKGRSPPLKPLTEQENQFLFKTADLMMQYPTIPPSPATTASIACRAHTGLIFRLCCYITIGV